ncbi:MAG: 50S ribosomal protein L21e [Nanoarchaeota archaeon]
MLSHKNIRQKGKFSLSRFFQKLKQGDKVAVVKELSIPFPYSYRLQGRTGTVVTQRGKAYEVEIKDLNKPKRYMIQPIHLKKIQS